MQEELRSASRSHVHTLSESGHAKGGWKIGKDRSKAVLVVPMGCTEDERTQDWVASLTNMTLNEVVLPAREIVSIRTLRDNRCHPEDRKQNSTMWIGTRNRPTPRTSCVSTK